MSRPPGTRPHRPHAFLFIALLHVLYGGTAWSVAAEAPDALESRLDEAVRRVDAARERGAPLGDPGALFPETEEVGRGDGTMRVDHASLRAEWAAVPAEGEARRAALSRLRDRLAAVRAELGPPRADGSGAMAPPARWRERLTEVLKRPEFKRREVQESLIDRLLMWLRDRLSSLFPDSAKETAGNVARWVVYGLGGVAVLLALAILVRAGLPLFRQEGTRPPSSESPAPEPETPGTLLALADARSRAGDYRGAVQAVFRWLLLRLHQEGRLEYDPALTNREHLTRLKLDGGGRAAFEELAAGFELAWYALRTVGPDEMMAFRTRAEALAGGRDA